MVASPRHEERRSEQSEPCLGVVESVLWGYASLNAGLRRAEQVAYLRLSHQVTLRGRRRQQARQHCCLAAGWPNQQHSLQKCLAIWCSSQNVARRGCRGKEEDPSTGLLGQKEQDVPAQGSLSQPQRDRLLALAGARGWAQDSLG